MPERDPLSKLPALYADVQTIIDNLPQLIQTKNAIVDAIQINNHLERVKAETDVYVIQALFRAYTFIASAYTLEQSYQQFKETGTYGKARTTIPIQISEPLVAVSAKLRILSRLFLGGIKVE